NIMRGIDARGRSPYGVSATVPVAEDPTRPENQQAEEKPLTRRQFIQALGMASVTAGAVSTTSLVTGGHSLGAPMSGGVYRRPWWVRQVDEPTTGIDWEVMQRVDAVRNTLARKPALGPFGSA